MSEELKPCPFCGSTHVIVDTTVPGAYISECLDCCTVISFCYPTKAEAIAAWNRRDVGVAIRTIEDAVMNNALERRNGSS